jgi:hypothetical protein
MMLRMSEANNNNKKHKTNTMTKEQTKMYKDLVIPNDANKDQIITLLSTILNVKNKTLTQLLGNNMRAEYVYVKGTKN